MKSPKILGTLALLSLLFGALPCTYAQNCQNVSGTQGASSQWGSGWIDVPTTTEFKKGERLRLALGGAATKVLVRILRSGESPDDPTGMVGQFDVSKSRIVEVTLKEDLKSVKQISVHGGPNPWGRFPLGGGNGPATLAGVERCSP
jgi:hypothetical protein